MSAPPSDAVMAESEPAPAALAAAAVEGSPEADPKAATRTLYISNLNEKVKLPVLKSSLEALFSTYGDVLSVTAHRNVRMRGQAFVAFSEEGAASKAVKEVAGFPLYGKPMQLDFARKPADAVLKKEIGSEDAPEFKAHKEARLEAKKKSRRNNHLRRKELERKKAAKSAGAGGDGVAPKAAPKRQEVQMPDEYLPPNKILFIQNVPANVGREQLEALFSPYAGFTDVRLIPGRPVAFAEFTDSAVSSVAKDALNGHSFAPDATIKITFAR